jgi:hypothetical protein
MLREGLDLRRGSSVPRIGDKAAIADGTVTDHGVVSGRGDVCEPVVELGRQGDPGCCFRNAISAGARCRQPKLISADSRSGPISSPRRSASSSRPSCASWRMRRVRDRKAQPSSVSDILRVVRWTRRAPSSRSSSARRSLTTDLGRPRRRAASLIDPPRQPLKKQRDLLVSSLFGVPEQQFRRRVTSPDKAA